MEQDAKEAGADTESITVEILLEEEEEEGMAFNNPEPTEEKIEDPTIEQDQDKKVTDDEEKTPPISMPEKGDEMTDTVEQSNTDTKDENIEDQGTSKIATKEKDAEITDTSEVPTSDTKEENVEDLETSKISTEDDVITIDEDTTDTEETPKLVIEEKEEVMDLTTDEQSSDADDFFNKAPVAEKGKEAAEQQSKLLEEVTQTIAQDIAAVQEPLPLTCCECPRTFTHLSELNKHMTSHISVEQHYTCNDCGEAFQCEDELDLHISLRHYREFDCNICGQSFKYYKDYYKHCNMHKHRKTVTLIKRIKKMPALIKYQKKVGESSGTAPEARRRGCSGDDTDDDD